MGRNPNRPGGNNPQGARGRARAGSDQIDCECDDPADDEDLFGFQGWTRGGTPIQEF